MTDLRQFYESALPQKKTIQTLNNPLIIRH